jgi:hypothetical protein
MEKTKRIIPCLSAVHGGKAIVNGRTKNFNWKLFYKKYDIIIIEII